MPIQNNNITSLFWDWYAEDNINYTNIGKIKGTQVASLPGNDGGTLASQHKFRNFILFYVATVL